MLISCADKLAYCTSLLISISDLNEPTYCPYLVELGAPGGALVGAR